MRSFSVTQQHPGFQTDDGTDTKTRLDRLRHVIANRFFTLSSQDIALETSKSADWFKSSLGAARDFSTCSTLLVSFLWLRNA